MARETRAKLRGQCVAVTSLGIGYTDDKRPLVTQFTTGAREHPNAVAWLDIKVGVPCLIIAYCY